MRKITCHCEQVFSVDLPETVNLDSNPELVTNIIEGNFLTFVCPACNATLHTDLSTRVDWPSKNSSLQLIPETERSAFMSGTLTISEELIPVIGYPELADRVAVLKAGLEAHAVEAVKYHLLERAETAPHVSDLIAVFEKITEQNELEFHIHGIREGEVAVSLVPMHLYQKIKQDISANPEKEPYAYLINNRYISVQNVSIEGNLND